MALLVSNPGGGWYVYVFRSEGTDSFALDWKSEKLDNSFAVASPGNLKTFDLGDEYGFTFQGCAAHSCPEFFSVLLYAPLAHKVFTASYENGKVSYSPVFDAAESKTYKLVLDDEIRRATRVTRP